MPSLHWPSSRPATRPPTRPPTRPGSPARTHSSAPSEDFPHQLTEALHATTSSTMIPPGHGPHPDDATSSRHGHGPPTLEIVLGQEYIHLKGTGRDVDPATLAGTIVLNLTERTSIKGITLQFRGKARLPMHSHDPLALHSHHATYVVCDHEWSFLEGTKAHSHTLKAGRHVFPFSVEIGGSLPSSIYTSVFGGAHVAYKLRATATRPGLAHNLSVVTPVTVLRGPGPDTLEFQQTLEIENTWPEKIMYAIALPHKAWALGDNVSALMKFEPLAKGAKVLSVVTTVNETVKMCPKSGVPTGSHEITRAVVSIKHEIHDGKAVCVEGPIFGRSRALGLPASAVHSSALAPATPGPSAPRRSHDISPVYTPSSGPSTAAEYFPAPAVGSSTSTTNASGSAEPSASTSNHLAQPQLAGAQDLQLPPELELDEPSTSTITTLSIPLPPQSGLTPSHSLDPIHTSHRIRWSILIGNADGHTSELRCSLPLLVLDTRLLESARAATLETRRLLLGVQEGDDDEGNTEEMDLPSYPAHVRDRVANMYVPASATVRVPGSGTRTPHTGTHSSGRSSPDLHAPLSANSGVDAPDALEWVTDELRQLAMSGVTIAPAPMRTSPEGSTHHSNAGSRWGSSHPSRASSPTPPEHPPPAASASSSTLSNGPVPAPSGSAESTYVHAAPPSRAPQGVFTAQMRPFTSLASSISSSFAGGSRSGSAGSLANYFASHAHTGPVYSPVLGPMSPTREHASVPRSGSLDAGSAAGGMEGLTRVPGYASSSRGFMGGVPPLSSVVGLPSYAEAESQRG